MSEVAEIQNVELQQSQCEEIVNKLFQPRKEIDKAGFGRKIYKLGEKEVIFRGKEELPKFQSLENTSTEIIGSKPKNTSMEDFKNWKSGFKHEDDLSSNTIVVSKDVSGVLSLLSIIDEKNADWRNMLSEINSGIYNPKTLDLIDKLIACNWVKENGTGWNEDQVAGDAEIIVIASLTGNTEAQNFVDKQLENMKELDKKRTVLFREEQEENWKYSEEKFTPVKLEDVVCTHATSYEPVNLGNGEFGVPTTADATGYEYVRNTVHVYLNSRVEGHMGGHWDKTPYTLISPIKSMLVENGNPSSIDFYDTWWVRNPGELLRFPSASIVKPGEVPDGKLYVIGEKETLFKAKDYTLNDLNSNDLVIPTWDKVSSYLVTKIKENDSLVKKWRVENFEEVFLRDCIDKISNENNPVINGLLTNIILENEGNILVKDIVRHILDGEKLISIYKGDPKGFNNAKLEIENMMTDLIEGEVFSQINKKACEATIEYRGFPLASNLHGQLGGSIARSLDALSSPSAHYHSIYHYFEDGLGLYIKEALTKKNGKEFFDWRKYDPKWPSLPKLDSKTRRVLYASGEFNARV